MGERSEKQLETFVDDRIWLRNYPIKYMGARFDARMTVLRLDSGGLVIHSPCPIDEPLAVAIAALGPVEAIVAPGNFHWFNVISCQQAFPDARTFVCPGVPEKCADLRYDELLGSEPPALWAGELDQVAIEGSKTMREVAFFDRRSKTLILVDSVENFSDRTPGTNFMIKFYFKPIGMWNHADFAPEYRFRWGDKAAARRSLERILAWEFDRVVLAHGDLIVDDARATVEHAWRRILKT